MYVEAVAVPKAGPGAEVGCPEVRVLVLLPLPLLQGGGGLHDELAGAGRLPQVPARLQPGRPGQGRGSSPLLPHHSSRGCLQEDRKKSGASSPKNLRYFRNISYALKAKYEKMFKLNFVIF